MDEQFLLLCVSMRPFGRLCPFVLRRPSLLFRCSCWRSFLAFLRGQHHGEVGFFLRGEPIVWIVLPGKIFQTIRRVLADRNTHNGSQNGRTLIGPEHNAPRNTHTHGQCAPHRDPTMTTNT